MSKRTEQPATSNSLKKFAYVVASVRRPDPEAVSFFNSLCEKARGQPTADLIPPVHPSSITFQHVFLEAENEEAAYELGKKLLEFPSDAVCNDYVVPLNT
jgi:hypothetical protein